MAFKVGDTVRIKDQTGGSSAPSFIGFEAVVQSHPDSGDGLVWLKPLSDRPDGHGRSNFFWNAPDLELVQPFKAGDKVKYIGSVMYNLRGQVGTIRSIDRSLPFPFHVDFEDSSANVPTEARELELVPEPVAPYYVGDLVRVKDNKGAPSWVDAGKVYRVAKTTLSPGIPKYGIEPWWLIGLDSGFKNGKEIGADSKNLELATIQAGDRVKVKLATGLHTVGDVYRVAKIDLSVFAEVRLEGTSYGLKLEEAQLLPAYDPGSRGNWTIARRDTFDPYFSKPWRDYGLGYGIGGYIRPYSGYAVDFAPETPLEASQRRLKETQKAVSTLENDKWKVEQRLKAYEEEVARLNRRIETRTRDYK